MSYTPPEHTGDSCLAYSDGAAIPSGLAVDPLPFSTHDTGFQHGSTINQSAAGVTPTEDGVYAITGFVNWDDSSAGDTVILSIGGGGIGNTVQATVPDATKGSCSSSATRLTAGVEVSLFVSPTRTAGITVSYAELAVIRVA